MDLTMWDFLVGSAMIAAIMATSFVIYGALIGIFAWTQLGANIWSIKRRAKTSSEEAFAYYWMELGKVIWARLQK
jgi:hypothetical protein